MATYGEVTRRIRFEVSADRSVSDTDMKDIVYDSILEVCSKCAPLSLVSKDESDALLRWIDDVNFLRQPIKPSGNAAEKIDIDDLLLDAVVYGACKRISRDRKGDYIRLMSSAINEYQWAMFESFEAGGCDVL